MLLLPAQFWTLPMKINWDTLNKRSLMKKNQWNCRKSGRRSNAVGCASMTGICGFKRQLAIGPINRTVLPLLRGFVCHGNMAWGAVILRRRQLLSVEWIYGWAPSRLRRPRRQIPLGIYPRRRQHPKWPFATLWPPAKRKMPKWHIAFGEIVGFLTQIPSPNGRWSAGLFSALLA